MEVKIDTAFRGPGRFGFEKGFLLAKLARSIVARLSPSAQECPKGQMRRFLYFLITAGQRRIVYALAGEGMAFVCTMWNSCGGFAAT
jgi:hypothetical protein